MFSTDCSIPLFTGHQQMVYMTSCPQPTSSTVDYHIDAGGRVWFSKCIAHKQSSLCSWFDRLCSIVLSLILKQLCQLSIYLSLDIWHSFLDILYLHYLSPQRLCAGHLFIVLFIVFIWSIFICMWRIYNKAGNKYMGYHAYCI